MKLSEIKDKIELEKKATEIESVPMKEVMTRSYEDLMATDENTIMSYGYDWLDKRLAGIFPGQVVLIGGETGAGKSTFASSILYKQKCPTAIFALEERLEEYGKKAMYFEIGKIRMQEGRKNYPYVAYVRGELNTDARFQEYFARAYDNLSKDYPLFQEVRETIIWELIAERIRYLSTIGIKMILLDHLHYFDLLAGKNNKNDYIEQIMTKMQTLAIETNMAIVLVAHYRKLNGSKPTLDSFKDSQSISQNSSTVINLWRSREQGMDEKDRYKTEIMIPKTRILGGEGMIKVKFNPASGEYEVEDDIWTIGTPIKEDNYDISKLDI